MKGCEENIAKQSGYPRISEVVDVDVDFAFEDLKEEMSLDRQR